MHNYEADLSIKTYDAFLHLAQKYFLTGKKYNTLFTNQFLFNWKWKGSPHFEQWYFFFLLMLESRSVTINKIVRKLQHLL